MILMLWAKVFVCKSAADCIAATVVSLTCTVEDEWAVYDYNLFKTQHELI